jgi:hypothetical protein
MDGQRGRGFGEVVEGGDFSKPGSRKRTALIGDFVCSISQILGCSANWPGHNRPNIIILSYSYAYITDPADNAS